MGRVVEAISGIDGKVEFKWITRIQKVCKEIIKYANSFVKIERPVQRLVLLQPHDETPNCDAGAGNVSSKI